MHTSKQPKTRQTNSPLVATALVAVLGLLASLLALVGPLGASPVVAQQTPQTATTFTPDVTINVPQISKANGPGSGPGNTANFFSGTEFRVRFESVFGPHLDCTASTTATYTVQDSGLVTQSYPATVLTLVDRPAGQTTSCIYELGWPTIGGQGWPTDTRLNREPGATSSIGASARSATATYTETSAVMFTPDVTITGPRLDANADGINDFLGIEFAVTFNAAPISRDMGCPGSTTGTYVVQDDGTATAPRPVMLMKFPANVGWSCYYGITWQSSAPSIRTQGTSASVGADWVRATYGATGTSYFLPLVSISVPDLDTNSDGINDYAGTTFEVLFSPTQSSPTGCTASGSGDYLVRDGGSVVAKRTSTLVDRLAGATTGCEYIVTFPQGAVGLEISSGAGGRVSATDRSVSATYRSVPIETFTPMVTITVPQTDANGDRVNDYAGIVFEVSLRNARGSTLGCTASDRATYVVQDSGAVELSVPWAGLVVRPIVGEPCDYSFTWPQDVPGLLRGEFSAVSTGAWGRVEYTANPSVSNPATFFTPTVAITIPQLDVNQDGTNDFAGRQFELTFGRVFGSDAGCTDAATATYVVRDSGAVSVSGTAPTLVDRPEGEPTGCAYTVSWPRVANLLRYTGTFTISATNKEAAANYRARVATRFSPDITIQVPQTDANGDGTNDFAGTQIAVSFSRVVVPGRDGADAGCTDSASAPYVVQDDGTVSGSAPSLVNTPTGQGFQCLYDVTWPDVAGLALQPRATGRIRSTNRVVFARYEVAAGTAAAAATSFSPDVDIVVPQVDADDNGANDFAGTNFVVTFRRVFGSDAGCTDAASATYIVQDSGAVTVSGTAPTLVDRPEGEPTGCAYTVSWPRVANLLRYTGTFTISATNKEAAANYRARVATRFSPDITIQVPQTDANGDGTNDFAGTQIAVSFSRVVVPGRDGADAGCSKPVSVPYTVQDDSSVSGSAPSLVNTPTGQGFQCLYDVTWPDVVGLVLQPRATGRIRSTNRVVFARYEAAAGTAGTAAAAATSFSPDVDIVVPQVDADDNGANDFAGTNFVVTFRRVFGSDSDCTDAATATYVVQDSGAVAGADPSLVDRPVGVAAGCSYVVTWPTVADLVRQFGATATVSASDRVASATYQTGPTYVAPEPEVEEPAVEGVEEPAAPEPAPEPEVDVAEPEAQEAPATESAPDPVPSAPVPEVGVVQLSQGWVMLPFNGPSGMSPAEFAQAMENSINSVWVWDMAAQQWKGWTSSRGSIGLTSLVPGDVVMVYAPIGGVVVYSPADLLGHRVGVNSWTLAPTGISLVVYGGGSATSASDVFASYANSAVVVYLWDSQNQRWEYHLPGRQPLSAVQVPWFSDINPGDAMFVYNISPTAVTIPWQ